MFTLSAGSFPGLTAAQYTALHNVLGKFPVALNIVWFLESTSVIEAHLEETSNAPQLDSGQVIDLNITERELAQLVQDQ